MKVSALLGPLTKRWLIDPAFFSSSVNGVTSGYLETCVRNGRYWISNTIATAMICVFFVHFAGLILLPHFEVLKAPESSMARGGIRMSQYWPPIREAGAYIMRPVAKKVKMIQVGGCLRTRKSARGRNSVSQCVSLARRFQKPKSHSMDQFHAC